MTAALVASFLPQVAFSADRVTSSQALTASTVSDLVFNSEVLDTDDAFDPGTGVFTAPSDGVYQFTAGIVLQNAASGSAILNDVYFSKNSATSGEGSRFSLGGLTRGGSIGAASNSFNLSGSCLMQTLF